MNDVTLILSAIEKGDTQTPEELLPLVYNELRKLAAARMANESPDHTLQATALVHEAYIPLLDVEQPQHWNHRGHFFAAASEATRRILVDNARRKTSLKRGAGLIVKDVDPIQIVAPDVSEDILALDEALTKLAETDQIAAELVKLRYFAGFTIPEAADKMGISARKANQIWSHARAWLATEISDEPPE